MAYINKLFHLTSANWFRHALRPSPISSRPTRDSVREAQSAIGEARENVRGAIGRGRRSECLDSMGGEEMNDEIIFPT
jgi:hypothetical protein